MKNAGELQELLQEVRGEMVGQKYRHFKGGIYEVTGIAINEYGTIGVIYRNVAENPEFLWTRTLKNFVEQLDMKEYPTAEQIMRFQRIEE